MPVHQSDGRFLQSEAVYAELRALHRKMQMPGEAISGCLLFSKDVELIH